MSTSRTVPRRPLPKSIALAASTAVLSAAGTGALLHRMRTELRQTGRLTPATAAWMYAAYGGHAAATATALARRAGEVQVPRPLRWLGGALTAAGTGLIIAGMRRFSGPGQVTGTEVGTTVTGGVYRVSRNPQYLGHVLQLGGLTMARRSAVAAASTAIVAVVYRWWIPVEEAGSPAAC